MILILTASNHTAEELVAPPWYLPKNWV